MSAEPTPVNVALPPVADEHLIGTEHGGLCFQLYALAAGENVRWRLLSANNRELGRSAQEYPDPDACRVAALGLRDRLHEVTVRVEAAPGNRWRWVVRDAVADVAVSGRTFDRRSRCRTAADRFVELVPYASMRDSFLISGSRRWTNAVPGPR